MTIINRCSDCNSTNIEKRKDLGGTWSMIAWIILAIATFGVSLLLTPFLRTTYRCKGCGTEWK